VKIVIVGCGRVGASLAASYDAAGHQVVILDISTKAFGRLADTFRGAAVRGDGTDEDTLRRVGAQDADVFLALTEGDNRNVMSAQVAAEGLGAKRVIAKINDPVRAAAYAELGLTTLCRTTLIADAISAHVGLPVSGLPGIHPSSGRHGSQGHELHQMYRSGAGEPGEASAATAGGATTGQEA
jgi:trk system potassium uptake protein TrkA